MLWVFMYWPWGSHCFSLFLVSSPMCSTVIRVVCRVSQNKFRRLELEGCGIKSMRPILKTKVLIYHSKANLDYKILFGKINHFKTQQ